MKDSIAPPNFPRSPDQFDPRAIDDHNRRLILFLMDLLSPGSVDMDTFRVLSIPTSASGLPAGSVFSDNNTLKIVLAVVNHKVTGVAATSGVGAVTILTP